MQGITNVVAEVFSRRPMSSTTCEATALVCIDSRFQSKLLSSFTLDTRAAATLAKLSTGNHVKCCNVDGYLLEFEIKRGLHRPYVLALHRTEALRKVHDHSLAGHGWVNTTVGKASRSFWRPRTRAAAEDYIFTCPNCQQLKPRNTPKPGLCKGFLFQNGSGRIPP